MTETHNEFRVDSVRAYNILVGLTKALPNLQQIELCNCRIDYSAEGDNWYIFQPGEDPTHRAFGGRQPVIYDVGVIEAFQKLRNLHISGDPLNGRYPRLFNNFTLLQKLHIEDNRMLKMDKEMLAGLPKLKELVYIEGFHRIAAVERVYIF